MTLVKFDFSVTTRLLVIKPSDIFVSKTIDYLVARQDFSYWYENKWPYAPLWCFLSF